MSDAIALVCAGCGMTVMRHPAMRLRRIACLECVQKAKGKLKRIRRQKRLDQERGRSGSDNTLAWISTERYSPNSRTAPSQSAESLAC
jgi:hypothetical protein